MTVTSILRHCALPALILAAVLLRTDANAFETSAREAILVDFETGSVLLEKNADDPMPPASMSKIMTVYLAFEQLKEGRLRMEDVITISRKARRMGGSRMFVEVNSQVSVEDILRGIIVQSGNDAAVALAEALAGSESEFAARMDEKARELGMSSSRFRNATGWPDPEHRTTARDLARLAARTVRDFPELYKMYEETSFTYNEIAQRNRNPLLGRTRGADGLKTGYTRAAGYGLTASAERDGRRLVLVINGVSSSARRAREAETLLEWGFREFDNFTLLRAGQPVEQGTVWLGVEPTVPLVLEEDLFLTLSHRNRSRLTVTVHMAEPVPAPITAGDHIATLRIEAPGTEAVERPLLAGRDVAALGVARRVVTTLGYLLWGHSG